jgi:hypothetical protein
MRAPQYNIKCNCGEVLFISEWGTEYPCKCNRKWALKNKIHFIEIIEIKSFTAVDPEGYFTINADKL